MAFTDEQNEQIRNDLIRDEKPTEDVDKLILKVIDAPTEKARKKADRAAR